MTRIPVVLLAALLSGCLEVVPGWEHPLVPVEALPWPAPALPPMCTPFATTFGPPAVAAPTGVLRLESSGSLVATGVVSVLDLIALTAVDGTRDMTVNGAVTLDLGAGATVLGLTAMEAGRARATIRVDQAGPFTATARLGARTGTNQLVAYTSQLPVWELTVDPVLLAMITAMPYERIKVDAVLTIDGTPYPGKVRLHGGSSRDYPKKAFRFDLASGLTLAGADHLILRSEWNDKSQLRNWLGFAVFREGTWLPTPDAELVHFRINDRFYGVMDHVERIDADFLRAHGMNIEGSLYEADPANRELPPGNLEPLQPDDYPLVYQQHLGPPDYSDLLALIEGTLQLPPGDFEATLPGELAVDDYLIYLATMAVLQNYDHMRKNYYLYRGPARREGWQVLPWDLELTFGHLWSEENDVLEERIVTDGDPFIGTGSSVLFNQMVDRVLAIPELRQRFLTLARRVAATTATPAWIEARLDHAVCLAMPELIADPRRRATTEEYLGRVREIVDFVAARRVVLDSLP